MARMLELNLGVTFTNTNVREVVKTAVKTFTATNALKHELTVTMNGGTATVTVPFSSTSTTLVVITSGELTVGFNSGSPTTAKSFKVKNMLVFEDSNFNSLQLTNASTTTDVEVTLYLV